MSTILQGRTRRDALLTTCLLLLGAGIVVCFCSLGFWQLDRAEQKQQAHSEFQRRGKLARLDLNQYETTQTAAAVVGYRAHATGRFHARSILLENQSHQGAAGYFVYTSLQLDGSSYAVLVNRGWVGMGRDRQTLPDVRAGDARIRITGKVSLPPSTGLRLAGSEIIERFSADVLRVQRIDFPSLSTALRQPLVPYTLRLDDTSPQGFVREWRAPGADQARHRGYAVQWFAMASALVVLMVVLLFRGWRRGG